MNEQGVLKVPKIFISQLVFLNCKNEGPNLKESLRF